MLGKDFLDKVLPHPLAENLLFWIKSFLVHIPLLLSCAPQNQTRFFALVECLTW